MTDSQYVVHVRLLGPALVVVVFFVTVVSSVLASGRLAGV